MLGHSEERVIAKLVLQMLDLLVLPLILSVYSSLSWFIHERICD